MVPADGDFWSICPAESMPIPWFDRYRRNSDVCSMTRTIRNEWPTSREVKLTDWAVATDPSLFGIGSP